MDDRGQEAEGGNKDGGSDPEGAAGDESLTKIKGVTRTKIPNKDQGPDPVGRARAAPRGDDGLKPSVVL